MSSASEFKIGDIAAGETWVGETGLVDTDLLKRLFAAPETKNWLFMLCGPSQMMENVEVALIDMGVAPRQILSERFTYD